MMIMGEDKKHAEAKLAEELNKMSESMRKELERDYQLIEKQTEQMSIMGEDKKHAEAKLAEELNKVSESMRKELERDYQVLLTNNEEMQQLKKQNKAIVQELSSVTSHFQDLILRGDIRTSDSTENLTEDNACENPGNNEKTFASVAKPRQNLSLVDPDSTPRLQKEDSKFFTPSTRKKRTEVRRIYNDGLPRPHTPGPGSHRITQPVSQSEDFTRRAHRVKKHTLQKGFSGQTPYPPVGVSINSRSVISPIHQESNQEKPVSSSKLLLRSNEEMQHYKQHKTMFQELSSVMSHLQVLEQRGVFETADSTENITEDNACEYPVNNEKAFARPRENLSPISPCSTPRLQWEDSKFFTLSTQKKNTEVRRIYSDRLPRPHTPGPGSHRITQPVSQSEEFTRHAGRIKKYTLRKGFSVETPYPPIGVNINSRSVISPLHQGSNQEKPVSTSKVLLRNNEDVQQCKQHNSAVFRDFSSLMSRLRDLMKRGDIRTPDSTDNLTDDNTCKNTFNNETEFASAARARDNLSSVSPGFTPKLRWGDSKLFTPSNKKKTTEVSTIYNARLPRPNTPDSRPHQIAQPVSQSEDDRIENSTLQNRFPIQTLAPPVIVSLNSRFALSSILQSSNQEKPVFSSRVGVKKDPKD